jgi:hypothetical protein
MLYADPGSGILIWQMLLALFIGATFYFSKVRTWVATKFRSVRPDEASKSATQTSTSTSVSRVE